MADNFENNLILNFLPDNEPIVDYHNPPYQEDDDFPSKLSILFVLLVCLSFVSIDFMSLYYTYDHILESSNALPALVFDKCIKYNEATEIFFTIFALLVGLSGVFLSLGFFFYEIFSEKLLNAYLYFNYYVFGPLLLGGSVLGFLNFKKVCYMCEGDDPTNMTLNVSMIISLLFLSVLGAIVTLGFSAGDMLEYFSESIKFSGDGNCFVGKIFWKLAMTRNRVQHNTRERNN